MWYPSGIFRRYVNGTLATVRSPSRVAHLGPRGSAAEQASHLSSSALTKMGDLATAAAGFVGSWRRDPGSISSRAPAATAPQWALFMAVVPPLVFASFTRLLGGASSRFNPFLNARGHGDLLRRLRAA